MTQKTTRKKRPATKKKHVPPVAPGDFKADLLKRLKNKDYAGEYLRVCMDESVDAFGQAFLDVLDAMGCKLRSTVKVDVRIVKKQEAL